MARPWRKHRKSGAELDPPTEEVVAYIDTHRDRFGRRADLRGPAGFAPSPPTTRLNSASPPACRRAVRDAELEAHIRRVEENYGVRQPGRSGVNSTGRVRSTLCPLPPVERLMRHDGPRCDPFGAGGGQRRSQRPARIGPRTWSRGPSSMPRAPNRSHTSDCSNSREPHNISQLWWQTSPMWPRGGAYVAFAGCRTTAGRARRRVLAIVTRPEFAATDVLGWRSGPPLLRDRPAWCGCVGCIGGTVMAKAPVVKGGAPSRRERSGVGTLGSCHSQHPHDERRCP